MIQHKDGPDCMRYQKTALTAASAKEKGRKGTEHMAKRRNTTRLWLATRETETTNIGCRALGMVRDDKGTKKET